MHTSSYNFHSNYLDRSVDLSFYQGDQHTPSFSHLIIINDGQDLHQMDLHQVLDRGGRSDVERLGRCAAGAGERRKLEHGVQWADDYKGRGDNANHYSQFITIELLPWLAMQFPLADKIDKTIAGWSLGGLSAIDIAWHAPHLFRKTGVFSGSLWWRNPGLIADDPHHRLMHHRIRHSSSKPELKFWFQAGTEDEKADRNNNGIIDVIDDTLDLIEELSVKGYQKGQDYHFHIEEGGKHDVETWTKMMPLFLNWVGRH